jgi:serine/threonine protein kinase
MSSSSSASSASSGGSGASGASSAGTVSIRIPFSEIREATESFSAARTLGTGQFGAVYSGTVRGVKVAIKKLNGTNRHEAKLFAREVSNLAACRSPHLLGLVGWSIDSATGQRYLVTEYVNGGSLTDRLASGVTLSLSQRVRLGMEVAAGLGVLHKAHIIHRDLKADNILLKQTLHGQFTAKIADFGLSRLSPELSRGHQAYVKRGRKRKKKKKKKENCISHSARPIANHTNHLLTPVFIFIFLSPTTVTRLSSGRRGTLTRCTS